MKSKEWKQMLCFTPDWWEFRGIVARCLKEALSSYQLGRNKSDWPSWSRTEGSLFNHFRNSFWTCLPFKDIFCGLFSWWICKIKPTDLGNISSGALREVLIQKERNRREIINNTLCCLKMCANDPCFWNFSAATFIFKVPQSIISSLAFHVLIFSQSSMHCVVELKSKHEIKIFFGRVCQHRHSFSDFQV